MPDAVTTPQDHPLLSERGVIVVPALVVVWSAVEPERVGEVALILADETDFILGRGEENPRLRLTLLRMRPGVSEPRPPIQAPSISREHLVIRWVAEGLQVKRRGTLAMRVNGVVCDEGLLEPGDTVEIVSASVWKRVNLDVLSRPG